eukprot:1143701-Pelagomonas_calceolata.AAC.2
MQYGVVKTVEVGGGGVQGARVVRAVGLAGGAGVEQVCEQRLGVSGADVNGSHARLSLSSRPLSGETVLSEGEVTVHEGQGALAALQQKQQELQQ